MNVLYTSLSLLYVTPLTCLKKEERKKGLAGLRSKQTKRRQEGPDKRTSEEKIHNVKKIACMRACVRACVRVCVCVCARALFKGAVKTK